MSAVADSTVARLVVPFASDQCRDIAVAGGKGANLAVLSTAGLSVPDGFCVTTSAYDEFASSIGLDNRVGNMLSTLGEDADSVEKATQELRNYITASPLPAAIANAILDAYQRLDPEGFVAVRSSGTAEDLAGASFAGLHDTYLDIRGADVVLDAVKRCWASMWSARATSYRRSKGFDQSVAKIAVVVQQMVEADVAGVMFTANPLTTATSEIVINATYGLGEALVSGIATPDEHVLALDTLRVKEQRVGAKEVKVVRDRATTFGTITQEVPPDDQKRFSLSAAQLVELGELGRRIMALYGGFPQDIEWAIADNKLFLLQARPITGADFSWDDELDHLDPKPDDDDTLWTRSWADEFWNGAISPLTYSYRNYMFTYAYEHNAEVWGISNSIPTKAFKYHKGEAYFDPRVQQAVIAGSTLPMFRPALLDHTPADAKEAILHAPMGVLAYLKMHARILAFGQPGNGPFKWHRMTSDYLANRVAEASGPSDEALRKISDKELCDLFEQFVVKKAVFTSDLWTGFFIYSRDSIGLLGGLVALWYDGDNPTAFADLLTGLPVRTTTSLENLWLWRLSERIRASKTLRETFESAGLNYLKAFESVAEGREFLAEYGRFVEAHGHRGHADRDMYFARRCEDPAIDHENFRMMLAATFSVDPEEREKQVNERRNAVVADVEARFRRLPFGGLRAWLFHRLLNYAHRFFLVRDNQRHFFDRFTFTMKRLALEMGRRLTERGMFEQKDDAYFLGRHELYALFDGAPCDALTRAKIAARRKNFDLMLNKQANPPLYLRRNKPVTVTAQVGSDETNLLRGSGTARGVVTARARIVKDLREIGQVAEGDILITNSTDPGWTPVFSLLKGIVLETGGMLAHGSCLAREYGLPAVQLAGATKLIPDGAMITVNGDTGEVLIHET